MDIIAAWIRIWIFRHLDIIDTSQEIFPQSNSVKLDLSVYETQLQYLEMANNNSTRQTCKLQYLEMANNKKHMQMNISQQKYARGS